MSTFLIIGGNSQIAEHYIMRHIENENDYFILIDKDPQSNSFSDYNNVKYFQLDVTNETEYTNLIEFLDKQSIKIDYLLHSVGINYGNNFFSTSITEFKSTLNINFLSLFYTLKSLYSYLNNQPSIVAIASQNGVVGHENRIDYGPSKAAIIQFAKNFSIDIANINDKDVKFNTISPGYIISDKSKEFLNSPKGKKLRKKIPFKKFVTLDNVTDTIEFLFSSKSEAIRGQNIVVDYGYTIT